MPPEFAKGVVPRLIRPSKTQVVPPDRSHKTSEQTTCKLHDNNFRCDRFAGILILGIEMYDSISTEKVSADSHSSPALKSAILIDLKFARRINRYCNNESPIGWDAVYTL